MKLTMFKGLAYDLVCHLCFLIYSGQPVIKVDFPVDRDVLKGKTRFDRYCVTFFKDRVPAHFDFSRIKNIHVHIKKSGLSSSVRVNVHIQVDDKTFSAL